MQLQVLNRCGVGCPVLQRGGHAGSENDHSSGRSSATALSVFLHFPFALLHCIKWFLPICKASKTKILFIQCLTKNQQSSIAAA